MTKGNILIVAPLPIAAITASRGTGASNLLTPDPREVWLDSETGSPVTLDIDLGFERIIDTVFLACILSAHPTATWEITGGLVGYDDSIIQTASPLRVVERDWRVRTMSHGLWFGTEQMVRYLRIVVTQPVGDGLLSIGAVVIGDGFQPKFNNEWGAGRGVRDTSVVTRLPSGGVSVVEGVRYGSYSWTLGDLSDVETDRLYELQLAVGESRPVLVVESPARTAGLRNRVHFGALTGLRPFERRNPAQTTWQMTVEQWALEPATIDVPRPIPSLTLGGVPLSLGGEILTLGN